MRKIKLDVKSVLLIAMAIVLIFMVVTKKSTKIDNHKDEIAKLHAQNKILKNKVDSLGKENLKLDSLFNVNQIEIDKKETIIAEKSHLIDELYKRRASTASSTLKMSADEVSDTFTKLLKNKK